jgi:hypothetical protein
LKAAYSAPSLSLGLSRRALSIAIASFASDRSHGDGDVITFHPP